MNITCRQQTHDYSQNLVKHTHVCCKNERKFAVDFGHSVVIEFGDWSCVVRKTSCVVRKKSCVVRKVVRSKVF